MDIPTERTSTNEDAANAEKQQASNPSLQAPEATARALYAAIRENVDFQNPGSLATPLLEAGKSFLKEVSSRLSEPQAVSSDQVQGATLPSLEIEGQQVPGKNKEGIAEVETKVADFIINELRRGDFSNKLLQQSVDGTATHGGDLDQLARLINLKAGKAGLHVNAFLDCYTETDLFRVIEEKYTGNAQQVNLYETVLPVMKQ